MSETITEDEVELFNCSQCLEDKDLNLDYQGESRTGRLLCGECVDKDWSFCHNCDVYVRDTHYNGDHDMCNRCLSDYRECNDCGYFAHIDCLYWCDDEEYRCDSCHDSYSNSDSGIPYLHEYHSGNPNGRKFWDVEDEPTHDPVKSQHFGVELESEGFDYMLGSIFESLEDDYIGHAETDGSLDRGTEFITNPATLDGWRGQFGLRVAEFMHDAKRNGSDFGRDSCGTHVHVSRTTFKDDMHLARLATFMIHNPKFIEKVSGRRYLDRWSKVSKYDKGELRSNIKWKNGDRYRALNLCNKDTVEVRMFAGNNEFHTVLGYVEFVAAIVEYTRDITINDILAGALLAENFTTWLEDAELSDYPYALQLVTTRNVR